MYSKIFTDETIFYPFSFARNSKSYTRSTLYFKCGFKKYIKYM